MDDMSLPKETYVYCATFMDEYYPIVTSGKFIYIFFFYVNEYASDRGFKCLRGLPVIETTLESSLPKVR